MMVGHSMLAFAIAAGGARLLGWSGERALRFGAVAAAFALVPDADMVYALAGVARADFTGVFVVTNAFWGASTEVHRSATHSLVLALPAACSFALWSLGSLRARLGAVTLSAALVGVAYLATGALDAFAVSAFALAGLGVAAAVGRWGILEPGAVLATALVGLVSHPFGDLFTGSAPVLLYPLQAPVIDGTVVLSGDPTVHLLGAFALELAAVWLAGLVYLDLTDTGLGEVVDARAALGVLYAPAALFLPPPTLEVSYHFVFSIVGVGLVLAAPAMGVGRVRTLLWGRPFRAQTDGGVGIDDAESEEVTSPPPAASSAVAVARRTLPRPVLTGSAAVTAAWLAYLTVYALT